MPIDSRNGAVRRFSQFLQKVFSGVLVLVVFVNAPDLFSQAATQALTPDQPSQNPAENDELKTPAGGGRSQFALGPEITWVGLSLGLRFEYLYDFSPDIGGHVLRVAPGFLYGPEFLYVPVALGYRLYLFDPAGWFRLFFGTGMEYQARLITDGRSAHQGAVYLETGGLFKPGSQIAASLHFGIDWAVLGPPGPGLITRVMFQW